MRQTLSRRPKRHQPRRRRPMTVPDGQGRPRGCHQLLELLRIHLDRGHPDGQDEADDLLLIAQRLNEVNISKTSRRRVIRYLTDIDDSRDVLGWPEIEDKLHGLLQKLISRLEHTHPRRPAMMKLPTADRLPPLARRPAHV